MSVPGFALRNYQEMESLGKSSLTAAMISGSAGLSLGSARR